MLNKKTQAYLRRKARIRKKIFGTHERPRMVIHKSNKNIYVQIVDDLKGVTLASASTLPPKADLSLTKKSTVNVKMASLLGEEIGKKASAVGIKNVVFDRSGYRYHGRVRAFAEAARTAGLNF